MIRWSRCVRCSTRRAAASEVDSGRASPSCHRRPPPPPRLPPPMLGTLRRVRGEPRIARTRCRWGGKNPAECRAGCRDARCCDKCANQPPGDRDVPTCLRRRGRTTVLGRVLRNAGPRPRPVQRASRRNRTRCKNQPAVVVPPPGLEPGTCGLPADQSGFVVWVLNHLSRATTIR